MVALREVFTRLGFETQAGELRQYEGQITKATRSMDQVGDRGAQAVSKISSAFGGMGRQLATWAAGIASAAGLHHVTNELAEQTHQLRLNAGAVGMTVEEYSRLSTATAQYVEDTSNGNKDLRDFMADLADYGRDAIANPMGGYGQDLKALGVELLDNNGKLKSQFDLLLAVSDAMTKVPLTSERMGIMSAVFSTGALEMSEFLKLGPEGIKAAMGAVDESVVLTKEQVQVTREYRAAMGQLAGVWQAIRMQIGQYIMPLMTRMVGRFVEFARNAEEVERVMRRLVMVARVLASVLAAALSAKGIGAGVAGIMKLVGAIRSATIWSALLKSLWLAIPIAIMAVGLLIEDVMVWLRGGDSLIGRFIKKYEGSNGPAGKIARWLVGIKPMIANLAQTAQKWVAKVQGWVAIAAAKIQATIPPIKAAVASVLAWVAPYAKAAYAWLKTAIPAAISAVISGVKTLWGWIKAAVGWVWDSTPGAIDAVVDSAMWLWDWIKRISLAVADAAMVAWDWAVRVGRVIADVATTVGRWLWSVAEDLFTALAPWIYGIAKLVQGVAKVVWGAIKGVGVVLWEVVQGIWPVLQAIGIFLWENIPPALDIIVQAARVVWHGVLLIVEWVGKAFAALAIGAEWLLDKAAMVVEGVIVAVGGMAGGIVRVAGEIVGWVIEKLSPLTAWILDKLAGIAGWIADGLESFNNGVSAFIVWLGKNLIDPISKMFSSTGNVIKGVFETIGRWIQPVIDLIDSTLGKAYRAAEMLGLADGSGERMDQINAVMDNNAQIMARGQQVQAWHQSGQLAGVAQADIEEFIRSGKSIDVGTIQVNIQGNTNMGAQDIATAVKAGAEEGMGNVGRDLAVGG